MPQEPYTAGEGRVWIQPSGCNTRMYYGGCYGMGDVTAPEGDITYIRCPSPSQPNTWDIVGKIVGTPGNKTTSLEAPLELINWLLSIKCEFNVQYRISKCNRPDDPTGWEVLLAFEGCRITSRGVTGINPRSPDNNAETLTTADITFNEMFFVKTHTFSAITVTASVGATLSDVHFCDDPTCAGPCGIGSAGCQVGYVATVGVTAEEIWKTTDGGATWTQITNPFAVPYTADIVALDCVGDIVILVNGTTASQIARSQDGGDSWTLIDVGGAQIVNDVFMLDSGNIWLCGEGGYIWHSTDGGLSWEMQEEGIATSNGLNEIHFASLDVGVAVGDAGTILATVDGGDTWESKTSGTANQLNTVYCVTELLIWVGGNSATLRYSIDKGDTWTTKTWPGGGTDHVRAITFCGCMFGFFGGTTATPAGVLYATYDGGYTFRQETLPANDGVNAVHCCDPNTVFVATNGSGRLLKAA